MRQTIRLPETTRDSAIHVYHAITEAYCIRGQVAKDYADYRRAGRRSPHVLERAAGYAAVADRDIANEWRSHVAMGLSFIDDHAGAVSLSAETVRQTPEDESESRPMFVRAYAHILFRSARFRDVVETTPGEVGSGEVRAYLEYIKGSLLIELGSCS